MNKKNIVSIEDRIPKLKKVRQQKANRRLIFYLSVFFILIAMIVYLQSPLSHVKKVIVKGNNHLTEEQVIKQSEITKETNLWSIKKSNIKGLLTEHPMVQSVEMKRKLPSTVEIHIVEHNHVGYVEDENEYLALLNNGVLYGSESLMEYQVPLIVNFDEQAIEPLAKELAQIPETIHQLISEIHLLETEDHQNKILLYMVDGFIVEASMGSFSEQMKAYPSIVSQLEKKDKGTIYLGKGAYFEPFAKE